MLTWRCGDCRQVVMLEVESAGEAAVVADELAASHVCRARREMLSEPA